MRRGGRGGRAPARRSAWPLVGLGLVAAGAVVGVAVLAQRRSEARQQAAASEAEGPPPAGRQAGPEEPPDPGLERLLTAAASADASVATLDNAAHALLVLERFEEAEPLVLRALKAAPGDSEATIHRAVLKGAAGDTASARADLERLGNGPGGWEASMFAGGFALNEGDDAAALRNFQRFTAQAPPGEVNPELRALMRELEERLKPSAAHKVPQKQP